MPSVDKHAMGSKSRHDRWLAEVPQPGRIGDPAVSPLLNECRGRRGQRRRHKRPADCAVGIVTRRAETPAAARWRFAP